MTTSTIDRYQQQLDSGDPIARAVAQRQLQRLSRPPALASQRRISRWVHVPLGTLFEQQGNRLHWRTNGQVETGHEPFHGSKSGRCVLLDPERGRWWCRSCRRSGDAARLVMDLHGWTYTEAATWLARRYGAPPLRRRLLEA